MLLSEPKGSLPPDDELPEPPDDELPEPPDDELPEPPDDELPELPDDVLPELPDDVLPESLELSESDEVPELSVLLDVFSEISVVDMAFLPVIVP